MQDQSLIDVEETLRRGGRSFHWARRFLGAEMGHDAARLYAFCRLLDDMADGDITGGPERLAVIREDLSRDRLPKDPAFGVFAPFMKEKSIPPEAVTALVDGLLMDQKPVRIEDEAGLIRYCYHVAGTVGLMMCHILNARGENAYAFAIDLGIAMQLTNIARDVLEDAKMGRRYLPASWVGKLTPEAMVSAASTSTDTNRENIASAVKNCLDLAERYYTSGITGLNYLPGRAHIAILVAAKVYRQIGIELSARHYAWHRGRVVTSTFVKARTSLLAAPLIRHRRLGLTDHEPALHIHLGGLPHANC